MGKLRPKQPRKACKGPVEGLGSGRDQCEFPDLGEVVVLANVSFEGCTQGRVAGTEGKSLAEQTRHTEHRAQVTARWGGLCLPAPLGSPVSDG